MKNTRLFGLIAYFPFYDQFNMFSENNKVNNFCYSPNLFTRSDGTPMEFHVQRSLDSNEVRQLIIDGGGVIGDDIDNADVQDSRIIYLASNTNSLKSRSDLVCSSFIYASCINDRCLDPKDFRFQPFEKSRNDSIGRENCSELSLGKQISFDFKMIWSIVKHLAKEEDVWKSICTNDKEFRDINWRAVRMKFILWAYNNIKLTAFEQICSESTLVSSQSMDKHSGENILREDLGESNENPIDENVCIIKEPNVKEQVNKPLPLKEQLKESGENKKNKRSKCLVKEMIRSKLKETKRDPSNCKSDDDSTSLNGSDTDFSDNKQEYNSAALGSQFFLASTPIASQSKNKHIGENILQEHLGGSDEDSDIIMEVNVKEQIPESLPLKEQLKESDGNKMSEWLGKDMKRSKLSKRDTNRIPPIDDSSSTEGSDSKSSVIVNEKRRVKADLRKPRMYSPNEDLILLKWIILRGNKITSLTGNRVWKFMEKRNVLPSRSWQSMKERFRKQIAPNVRKYPLSKEEFKWLRQIGIGKCRREDSGDVYYQRKKSIERRIPAVQ